MALTFDEVAAAGKRSPIRPEEQGALETPTVPVSSRGLTFDEVAQKPKPSSIMIPEEIEPGTFSIMGRPMKRDEIAQLEGGDDLLSIVDKSKQGRRGFGEAITDVGWSDVPFVGDVVGVALPIRKMFQIPGILKRMEAGEKVEPQELVDLQLYLADTERKSQESMGGKAGDIIRAMPGFAAPFWAASFVMPEVVVPAMILGKGATMARSAMRKAAEVMIGNRATAMASKLAAETMVGRSAERMVRAAVPEIPRMLVGGLGMGAADTAVNAVWNTAVNDMNPLESRGSIERMIGAEIEGSDLTPGQARMLALGDNMIEYVSEFAGPALVAPVVGEALGAAKLLTRGVQRGLPGLPALLEKVGAGDYVKEGSRFRTFYDKTTGGPAKVEAWLTEKAKQAPPAAGDTFAMASGRWMARQMVENDITPQQAWNQLRKAGYDGWLEEMGEERIGGFMKGFLGISGDDDGGLKNALSESMPASMDDAMAEAIAFAVPLAVPRMIQTAQMSKWLGGPGMGQARQHLENIVSAAGKSKNIIETYDGKVINAVPAREADTLAPEGQPIKDQATIDVGADSTMELAALRNQIGNARPNWLQRTLYWGLESVNALATGDYSFTGTSGRMLGQFGLSDLPAKANQVRDAALANMTEEERAKPGAQEEADKAARLYVKQALQWSRESVALESDHMAEALKKARALVPDGEEPTINELIKVAQQAGLVQYVDIGDKRQLVMVTDVPESTPEANSRQAKLVDLMAETLRAAGLQSNNQISLDKMQAATPGRGINKADALARIPHRAFTVADLESVAQNPRTAAGLALAAAANIWVTTKQGFNRTQQYARDLAAAVKLASDRKTLKVGGDTFLIVPDATLPDVVRVMPLDRTSVTAQATAKSINEGSATEDSLRTQYGDDSILARGPDAVRLMAPTRLVTKDPVLAVSWAGASYGWNQALTAQYRHPDTDNKTKINIENKAKDLLKSIGFKAENGVWSFAPAGFNDESVIHIAAGVHRYNVGEELIEQTGTQLALAQEMDLAEVLPQAAKYRDEVANMIRERKDSKDNALLEWLGSEEGFKEFSAKALAATVLGANLSTLKLPYATEMATKYATDMRKLPTFGAFLTEMNALVFAQRQKGAQPASIATMFYQHFGNLDAGADYMDAVKKDITTKTGEAKSTGTKAKRDEGEEKPDRNVEAMKRVLAEDKSRREQAADAGEDTPLDAPPAVAPPVVTPPITPPVVTPPVVTPSAPDDTTKAPTDTTPLVTPADAGDLLFPPAETEVLSEDQTIQQLLSGQPIGGEKKVETSLVQDLRKDPRQWRYWKPWIQMHMKVPDNRLNPILVANAAQTLLQDPGVTTKFIQQVEADPEYLGTARTRVTDPVDADSRGGEAGEVNESGDESKGDNQDARDELAREYNAFYLGAAGIVQRMIAADVPGRAPVEELQHALSRESYPEIAAAMTSDAAFRRFANERVKTRTADTVAANDSARGLLKEPVQQMTQYAKASKAQSEVAVWRALAAVGYVNAFAIYRKYNQGQLNRAVTYNVGADIQGNFIKAQSEEATARPAGRMLRDLRASADKTFSQTNAAELQVLVDKLNAIAKTHNRDKPAQQTLDELKSVFNQVFGQPEFWNFALDYDTVRSSDVLVAKYIYYLASNLKAALSAVQQDANRTPGAVASLFFGTKMEDEKGFQRSPLQAIVDGTLHNRPALMARSPEGDTVSMYGLPAPTDKLLKDAGLQKVIILGATGEKPSTNQRRLNEEENPTEPVAINGDNLSLDELITLAKHDYAVVQTTKASGWVIPILAGEKSSPMGIWLSRDKFAEFGINDDTPAGEAFDNAARKVHEIVYGGLAPMFEKGTDILKRLKPALVSGEPLVPGFIATADDGTVPVLVLDGKDWDGQGYLSDDRWQQTTRARRALGVSHSLKAHIVNIAKGITLKGLWMPASTMAKEPGAADSLAAQLLNEAGIPGLYLVTDRGAGKYVGQKPTPWSKMIGGIKRTGVVIRITPTEDIKETTDLEDTTNITEKKVPAPVPIDLGSALPAKNMKEIGEALGNYYAEIASEMPRDPAELAESLDRLDMVADAEFIRQGGVPGYSTRFRINPVRGAQMARVFSLRLPGLRVTMTPSNGADKFVHPYYNHPTHGLRYEMVRFNVKGARYAESVRTSFADQQAQDAYDTITQGIEDEGLRRAAANIGRSLGIGLAPETQDVVDLFEAWNNPETRATAAQLLQLVMQDARGLAPVASDYSDLWASGTLDRAAIIDADDKTNPVPGTIYVLGHLALVNHTPAGTMRNHTVARLTEPANDNEGQNVLVMHHVTTQAQSVDFDGDQDLIELWSSEDSPRARMGNELIRIAADTVKTMDPGIRDAVVHPEFMDDAVIVIDGKPVKLSTLLSGEQFKLVGGVPQNAEQMAQLGEYLFDNSISRGMVVAAGRDARYVNNLGGIWNRSVTLNLGGTEYTFGRGVGHSFASDSLASQAWMNIIEAIITGIKEPGRPLYLGLRKELLGMLRTMMSGQEFKSLDDVKSFLSNWASWVNSDPLAQLLVEKQRAWSRGNSLYDRQAMELARKAWNKQHPGSPAVTRADDMWVIQELSNIQQIPMEDAADRVMPFLQLDGLSKQHIGLARSLNSINWPRVPNASDASGFKALNDSLDAIDAGGYPDSPLGILLPRDVAEESWVLAAKQLEDLIRPLYADAAIFTVGGRALVRNLGMLSKRRVDNLNAAFNRLGMLSAVSHEIDGRMAQELQNRNKTPDMSYADTRKFNTGGILTALITAARSAARGDPAMSELASQVGANDFLLRLLPINDKGRVEIADREPVDEMPALDRLRSDRAFQALGTMGPLEVLGFKLTGTQVQAIAVLHALDAYAEKSGTIAGNFFGLLPASYLATMSQRAAADAKDPRFFDGVNNPGTEDFPYPQLTAMSWRPDTWALPYRWITAPKAKVTPRGETGPGPARVHTPVTGSSTLPPATKPVNVWFASGENAVLSNLSPRSFSYDGRTFRSVEHAYQSLKSGTFDKDTWDKYQAAKSVAGLKITGKPAKTADRWNIRLMEELMRASFNQSFEASAALKATGDSPLTHTQDRGLWSVEFPRILTAIRNELANTTFEGEAPATTASLKDIAPVEPDRTFSPTTFGEAMQVLESQNTILSNSEARILADKLKLRPNEPMPRVLVASERTDPVWYAERVKKLVASGKYDAIYLITKHDGLPIRSLLQLPLPKLIHFSITTLGGTAWEPGVMKWQDLMNRIADFVKQGLSPEDITIRIDPIVPGITNMDAVSEVIKRAAQLGIKRIRYSVMDGYSGAIEAKVRTLAPQILEAHYTRVNGKMEAKQEVIDALSTQILNLARDAGIPEVGSCAERITVPGIRKEGCLPPQAVANLVGHDVDDSKSAQRALCLCFGGKVDGFAYTDKCPSSCVYCYAKHGSDVANQYYNPDGTLKVNPLTQTRPGDVSPSVPAPPASQGLLPQAQAPIEAKAPVVSSTGYLGEVPVAPDATLRKGSPTGDAKDVEMRKVATGMIPDGEPRDRSSTKTSLDQVGPLDENSTVVMLARNGERSGRPLEVETMRLMDQAVQVSGFQHFVVGDMPSVDSQFVSYMLQKGYPFKVYFTTDTGNRIKKLLPTTPVEAEAPVTPAAAISAGTPQQQIASETTAAKPLIVYSDGSDIKGTGRIGYGIWTEWNGKPYEISGTNETAETKALQAMFPDAKLSNPTMEMLALAKVLDTFSGTPVHMLIRQDYKGAVNYDGLWQRAIPNAQRDPKPWKAKEAYIAHLRDRATQAIDSIEAAGGSVRIEWVRGHQTGGGEIARGNDNADRVAKSREAKNDFVTGAAETQTSLLSSTASLAAAVALASATPQRAEAGAPPQQVQVAEPRLQFESPEFHRAFNTPLSAAEEQKFQAWLKSGVPNIALDLYTYDLRGFWKDVEDNPTDANLENRANFALRRGHAPDTWKKPNHPTFSDESIYSTGKPWVGGHWFDENTFAPSAEMLATTHPEAEYLRYMREMQPGLTIVLLGGRPQARTDVPMPPMIRETEGGTGRVAMNGRPLIGIGNHDMSADDAEAKRAFEKATGVKWLDARTGKVTLTQAQMESLLVSDWNIHTAKARRRFPDFDKYPVGVQTAVVDMMYIGLKAPKFFDAIRRQDWATAIREISVANDDFMKRRQGLKKDRAAAPTVWRYQDVTNALRQAMQPRRDVSMAPVAGEHDVQASIVPTETLIPESLRLAQDLVERLKQRALLEATDQPQYSLVAETVEEWKRSNKIQYNPQEAYDLGEGFFHDLGAFNPKSRELFSRLAKTLLTQSRNMRRGDIRWWEDPQHQVIVSGYTALDTSRAPTYGHTGGDWSPVDEAEVRKAWEVELTKLYEDPADTMSAGMPDKWAFAWDHTSPEGTTSTIYNRYRRTPAGTWETDSVEEFEQRAGFVRPSPGAMRLVIRPHSSDVIWAAVGDVYSGAVRTSGEALHSASGRDFDTWEEAAEDASKEYGIPWNGTFESSPAWAGVGKLGDEIEFNTYTKDGVRITVSGMGNSGRAGWQSFAEEAPKVEPKAPLADKLLLLTSSIAAAIAGRRSWNYNELGVRLRIGNFYIEDTSDPSMRDAPMPDAWEQNDVRYHKNDQGQWVITPAGEFLENENGDEWIISEYHALAAWRKKTSPTSIPSELQRFNENLKKAFIAVHGSLDPTAPYGAGITRPAGSRRMAPSAAPLTSDVQTSLVQAPSAPEEQEEYDDILYRYRPEYRGQSLPKIQTKHPGESWYGGVLKTDPQTAVVVNTVEVDEAGGAHRPGSSGVYAWGKITAQQYAAVVDKTLDPHTLDLPGANSTQLQQMHDEGLWLRRDSGSDVQTSLVPTTWGNAVSRVAYRMFPGKSRRARIGRSEFNKSYKDHVLFIQKPEISDVARERTVKYLEQRAPLLAQEVRKLLASDPIKPVPPKQQIADATRNPADVGPEEQAEVKPRLDRLNQAADQANVSRSLVNRPSESRKPTPQTAVTLAQTPEAAGRAAVERYLESKYPPGSKIPNGERSAMINNINNAVRHAPVDNQRGFENHLAAMSPRLNFAIEGDLIAWSRQNLLPAQGTQFPLTQTSLVISDEWFARAMMKTQPTGRRAMQERLIREAAWMNGLQGRMANFVNYWNSYLGIQDIDTNGDIMKMVKRDLPVGTLQAGTPGAMETLGVPVRTFLGLRTAGSFDEAERQTMHLWMNAVDKYREEGDESRVFTAVPVGLENEDALLAKLLPPELFAKLQTARMVAKQKAADKNMLSPANTDQAYWSALRDAGWAATQLVDGQYTKPEWTIPVTAIEAEFQRSAQGKLVKAGRDIDVLNMKAFSKLLAAEYDYYHAEINKQRPQMLFTEDNGYLPYQELYIPHRYGQGFLGSEALEVRADLKRSLDKVKKDKQEIYEGVLDVSRTKRGQPRPLTDVTERMWKYLTDLKGIPYTNPNAIIADIQSGRLKDQYGLVPGMTYADIARVVHNEVENRLTQRALTQQTLDTPFTGVPNIDDPLALLAYLKKGMTRFKDREHSQHVMQRRFKNYMEAYTSAGIRPGDFGATKVMHDYVGNILGVTYRKYLLNQFAVMQDTDGAPLMILDPTQESSEEQKSIFADDVLALHSELLSKYFEIPLDMKLPVRERLHKLVEQSQIRQGRGLSMYERIDSPYPSIQDFFARKEVTSEANVLDMLVGGEAAGILKHVIGERYEDAWGIMNGLATFNHWIKLAALQLSGFFGMSSVESIVAAQVGLADKLKDLADLGEISPLNLRRMAKANHPYVRELLRVMQAAGIQVSQSVHTFGLDAGRLNADINNVTEWVSAHMGVEYGKRAKQLMTLPMANSEIMFGTIFNTAKMWMAARILSKARRYAQENNIEFDPVQALRPWANTVDNSLGDPNMNLYSFMTPGFRQFFELTMFSMPWTLAAWNIAGGGMLTQNLLKNYVEPHELKFIAKNWAGMAVGVLWLLPMLTQLAVYLGFGDPDKDRPFIWDNETNRRFHIDITPLLRSPVGNFLTNPASIFGVGQYEGEPTGDRRYYIRWGKQAYEVLNGWMVDARKTAMGKMSQVARLAFELVTGTSPGSEWDLGFKNQGLTGLILDKDNEFKGSVLGTIAGKFMPFSILAWARNPSAGTLNLIAPVSKGTSYHVATSAYYQILRTWANEDTYAKLYADPKLRSNLEALGADILDAAQRNGYEPKEVLKSARGAVFKELYAEFYKALDSQNQEGIERASRKIMRVNGSVDGLLRSVRNRDRMYGEAGPRTPEQLAAITAAFERP